MYLIAAESASADSFPAPSGEQRVVRYGCKFLRNDEAKQPRYLLLPKKADVPLVLAKEPELNPNGENGFPEIRLELTPGPAQEE